MKNMNLFKQTLGSICVLFFLACVAESADFSVVQNGATPDGVKDSTAAFTSTWKAACAAEGANTFVIPKGTFMVGAVSFTGPCKGAITFQIDGTVKADPNPSKFVDNWIVFERLTGITVQGAGSFDGQGQIAWKGNNCQRGSGEGKCKGLPINIRFNFVENSFITGIHVLNSKLFQINVMGCKNVTFQYVTVTAPGESINTDGIHIGDSEGVNVTDTVIAGGDDCVSMGSGSVNIKVTNVTCGPGHGISVGSLGKYPNEKPVSGITVRNCTIKGTMNGVRIKTWPKSQVGTASDFIFEDIVMDNVQNPVYIDQEYCPWNNCNKDAPSQVKISHVTINRIRGTSATQNVVTIKCSKGVPCEDVKIGDVDLKYIGKDGPATANCTFAKPVFTGVQNPKIAVV